MPSVLGEPAALNSVLGDGTPPVPPVAPPVVPPVSHRSFTDAAAIRKNIYDNVLSAVNNIGALANTRHTLTLHDPHYVDPEDMDLRKQKEAILGGKSLARRLRGTWKLTDNATRQVLDQKTVTLAQVPHMTQDGLFVLNGTPYSLSNQMRLRPGVFTRLKANGEIESHVNVLPGNGVSHRYFLDPESGVFKINIGQAKVPLAPIMRAIGVTDKELREAWGQDLFSANWQAHDGKALSKVYQRMIRKADPNATEEDKAKAVAEFLHNMKLDPEVTRNTLGKPHDHLSKDALLDTTRKLIRVSRQEEEPDDRDHLAFQNFYGPEDLLAERITKDKAYLRQLLWKASFKGDLSSMQPGALTRQLNTTILGTGLGQAIEGTNMAELLDIMSRTTRLGEGGIGSLDAVPEDSRAVQPSQLAFVDPSRTAESAKVGIDSRIASAAVKGSDGRLYAPMIDVKTGKTILRTPQDLAAAVLAFPGQMATGKAYVAAQAAGTTKFVPRESVDYEMPHMENAFSPVGNIFPLKSALKGQRYAMGNRFMTQALTLVKREAPLVQTAMPGRHLERSFEEHYGTRLGAVRASAGGFVKKVTPDEVVIKQDDGEEKTYHLYNNFPGARKTYVHSTPQVKSGQRIEPDQLISTSNQTDDKGVMALGNNARVAFLPYRGSNYEDAIIASQSYANRTTSQHLYQHDHRWSDKTKRGLKSFIALHPTAYTKQQLSNMGDDGIVKPGATVHYGDPLILVAEEKDQTYTKLHRGSKPSYSNKSVVWDHHDPGTVTDVATTGRGVNVAVKSDNATQVADKFALLHGSKGVLSEIVPDDQMPHDEQGRPFDLLLNPTSIISRINPSQVATMLLGKVAEKRGEAYKLEDFSKIPDLIDFTEQELKKHNMSDTETVTDPATGRKIPGVLTGMQFVMKLHHTASAKDQGRGIGGYSSDLTPARGGADGSAKKVAMLETNALLSHGATEVLRDAHVVRGQKNDAYWQAFMSGHRTPEPDVPLVYRKFVDSLKGSGINVVRDGRQLHIMALTDKDVDTLAGDRDLKNTDTVDWKEGLKPKDGGMFDMGLTGGHGGNRWSAIKLMEPMPNPAFEEPIRRMLGLTQKKLEAVIGGTEQLGTFGTGSQAIKAALGNLNVDKEIEKARHEIAGTKRGAKDEAIRKLAYLKSAKRLGLKPEDWVLSRVPVLPPVYRPVSAMVGTGNQLVSDANYLYKELFDADSALRALHGRTSDLSEERLNVYNAFKGVVGLGEPLQPKNQERQVKGLLKQVFGTAPKFGMMQSKLLGASVELVGRSSVTPSADLDMDSLGIPENTAWDVYKPFIIRRLVQRGVPRLEAARHYKDQSKLARDMLLEELSHRPVIMTRAPALHRYSMMAFHPKLVKGDAVLVPPLVVAGFGMDFDGDAANWHVPASEEARKEALEKMLPSKNLLAAGNFQAHYLPRHEYQGGLYHASTAKDEKRRPSVFRNVQDAIRAHAEGRVNLDSPVEILQP